MIDFRFVADYIKHRFTSKTRHGVHSPFVYKLVDEVIYADADADICLEVESLRNKLKGDTRKITVTDLGAGSHLNSNLEKSVGTIAKNALKSPKLAQLLFRLVRYFKPRNVIELGTCLGTTSVYLSKAAPDAQVTTIEGCPRTAGIASETLKNADAKNVKQLVGNFDQLFPVLVDESEFLDFVFIDGNHRKDATLNYFNACLPKVNENSVLIFDDIYWSEGMKQAWTEVKNNPQVTVTVDLFWIGLVFFKGRQRKEHFKIRF
ncbi:SAM-dependent methyltransferase [Pedobacter sp. HMF7647]|uniref:SAM-dependent methyltransferase n=1 Tax=Hufsiella arboris TaxID=2695275 RepID=A0A7K1Y5V5_9SPHI|nr:class I SAM-dependent methyltransferase [Hufsiella arboris]MXV49408.1 SAM-dependent methyltransferase [Hufsiella arboris]